MSDCNCECAQIADVNQCADNLIFELGIEFAEVDLIFNITGRSKRIYRIAITPNEDGTAIIPTSMLPVGYLSVHTAGKYKVWFDNADTNEIILTCYEFRANSVLNSLSSGIITPTLTVPNENIFIEISEKGNDDVVTHEYGKLRIVTFYDFDDSNRQRNDFYNASVVDGQFTLKNDYTNDKFNGKHLEAL